MAQLGIVRINDEGREMKPVWFSVSVCVLTDFLGGFGQITCYSSG